ncbi:MAG: hypothetical protein PUP93_21155 [Rhizonema sp. NSF051]|nr:hypothetical protein [Rhizonema sp. NSF051]
MIEYQIGAWRLISGSAHPFDESAIRELAGADFDRTPNLMKIFNDALSNCVSPPEDLGVYPINYQSMNYQRRETDEFICALLSRY